MFRRVCVARVSHPSFVTGGWDVVRRGHPAPFSVSRITEALVFVPAQLQADAVNVAQTLPDRAADPHTIAKLLRGGDIMMSRDVDAAADYCAGLAAARYCHHYEAALERVHLVFVASLREAVSCLARLHVGSHPAAILAGALAAMQVSGCVAGAPGSVEASNASRAGAIRADRASRCTVGEQSADADRSLVSSGQGNGGAADTAGESVTPPAAHQWLRLEVLGGCVPSAPGRAGATRHDPTAPSGGGGTGDRAGAAAFAAAFSHLRMPLGATDAGTPYAAASGAAAAAAATQASLSAASTFIGFHGFDLLLWGHALELGIAKHTYSAAAADGNGGGRGEGSHSADAHAAGRATEHAAPHGRAAGGGPASSTSSGAHWVAGLDADRGAAFENPFVLSAAARTLALATNALHHSTSLWRRTEAGIAEKLSSGDGPTAVAGVAHPWGPAAAAPGAMLHLGLLHPAALHLETSAGSDVATAGRSATEAAATAHASTGTMHLSRASGPDRGVALALEHTSLASLLARLGATLLVEAAG